MTRKSYKNLFQAIFALYYFNGYQFHLYLNAIKSAIAQHNSQITWIVQNLEEILIEFYKKDTSIHRNWPNANFNLINCGGYG
ncbi:MAG: hypothetical protein DRO00_01670 [Thermoproteota archaeon]|nr:MAG: hypothetical protein DRO00_01670 [Candidatus Korarchaeota archaeon]